MVGTGKQTGALCGDSLQVGKFPNAVPVYIPAKKHRSTPYARTTGWHGAFLYRPVLKNES
ncbi:hypothetical protein B6259_02870 [Ruminococcaceae bacterium CPB6]|nr:hypothetical protein B6259_02870 [Ruminococcaceae bacterium CPB6]